MINIYLDYDYDLSARQIVDRKVDPSSMIQINFLNRANIKPSRLATVTWTEDVDVERCAICVSDYNIFFVFFLLLFVEKEELEGKQKI